MSKDMNKLWLKITKYSIRLGLFIFLFIGFFISKKVAIIYLFGVLIALINSIVRLKTITFWLCSKKILLLITSVLRVIIVALCVIPFINNFLSVISYILGIITHQVVMIYCTIKNERKWYFWKKLYLFIPLTWGTSQ